MRAWTRKGALRAASLGGVALLGGCSGGDAVAATFEPAPLVVVTIDTLRADHLGCYGYFRDTSPHIDRFAEEAVLFENALTTIPTTLAAHLSLWTSRYPLQNGVLTNDVRFRAGAGEGETRLLAQMLKELGYATAAFVSATPVKAQSGIAAGFDHYDEPEESSRPAVLTMERALAWLAERPDDAFFLWVHLFDPHSPYTPPGPLSRAFQSDVALKSFLTERGFPNPDKKLIQRIHNLYDGEIVFADRHVQELFDALRDRGIWDEATVVVMADHGEGLGQHRHRGHGEVYNEQVRVPLIVKFPERLGWNGRREPRLVSCVDVVPTLIESLGIPLPAADRARFEGVNVMGGGPGRSFALSQRVDHEAQGPGGAELYTLVGPRWKYLHTTDGREELYDLAEDPHEVSDVAAENRAVARAMKARLLQLLEAQRASAGGLEILGQVSVEALEELQKLGYAR